MSSPPRAGILDWVKGMSNLGLLNREEKATNSVCHDDTEVPCYYSSPRCHMCKEAIGEGSAIFMFNDLRFCSQRHRFQAAELKERQDAFRGHEISPAPHASHTGGRRWI